MKLISKKESKLTEIDYILTGQINPQIEKLRKDKENLLQYTSNKEQLTEMKKIIIKYQAQENTLKQNNLQSELQNIQLTKQSLRHKLQQLSELKKTLNLELQQFKQQQTSDDDVNSILSELFAHEKQIRSSLVNFNSKKANCDKVFENCTSELGICEKKSLKIQNLKEKNVIQKKDLEFLMQKFEIEGKEKKSKLVDVMRNLQRFKSGAGADAASERDAMEKEVKVCKERIVKAQNELKRKNQKVKTLKSEQNDRKKSLGKVRERIQQISSDKVSISQEIKDLKLQLQGNFSFSGLF